MVTRKDAHSGQFGTTRIWVSYTQSGNHTRFHVKFYWKCASSVTQWYSPWGKWTGYITDGHNYSGQSSKSPGNTGWNKVLDKYVNVQHDGQGKIGQRNFKFNFGDTGTSGMGNPPEISLWVTPPRIKQKPGKPSKPTFPSRGLNNIRVKMTEPSYEGGADVKDFRLHFKGQENHYRNIHQPVGSAYYNVNILSPGTTYQFRYRAKNSVGWGPYSSWASQSTTSTKPKAPSLSSLSVKSSSKIGASWSHPNDMGRSIDKYQVRWSTSSGMGGASSHTTGTGRSYTVSNLSHSTRYYVQVRAHNSHGWSGWSNKRQATTQDVKPPAPSMGAVSSVTPVSFKVHYSSTGDGGASLTAWQVRYATSASMSGAVVKGAGAGSKSLTGLTPASHYWVQVRVKNHVGWSPWSGKADQVTPSTQPPTFSVAAAPVGTSATVSMSVPAGMGVPDSWDVQYRVTGAGSASTASGIVSSTWVKAGLTPGESYDWRVRFTVGGYHSGWAAWTTLVQPDPNTSPGDYYDGDTAAKDSVAYSWAGTAGLSKTVVTGRHPVGWLTYADGSNGVGGEGAVYQVTGGQSHNKAARAVFWEDLTAAGFRIGADDTDTGHMSAVAESGVYTGTAYVAPSRGQRVRAVLVWQDASGASTGSDSVGVDVTVPAGVFRRVAVTGTAPAGTKFAAVQVEDYDDGSVWSAWQSGDTVDVDSLMVSLGGTHAYFDGDTQDSAEWLYDWDAVAHKSASFRTVNPVGSTNPLEDPNCPPPPKAPQPPRVENDCIDEIDKWRRYWVVIPAEEVSQWLSIVPTLIVSTGGVEASQTRIRVWANPAGVDPEAFDGPDYEAEQIVGYLPPHTDLTIDGVTERVWADVAGDGQRIAADSLLYGTDGTPATWTVLSCGTPYLISFDVPLDAPEGNVSVDVRLTTRSL